jgi:hypothetical protein
MRGTPRLNAVASADLRVGGQGLPVKACPGFVSPAGHRSQLIVAGAFVLATFVALRPCRAENPVFDALVNRGVPVGANEVLRLPAPTLADGLTAAEQRRAVEAIAGESHTWEDLTLKSVVAPFVLRISNDEGQPERRGRRLDVWFVAYGSLKTLENQDFLQKQFRSATSEGDPENGSTSKRLTSADLKRRGLTSSGRSEDTEYIAVEFTLLDRVRLQTTTESTRSRTAESNLAASLLDPRFVNDAEFPNQWRPVTRDDAGRRHFGEPQPYSGFGGYAKATRLVEPPGAILIEYHAAFSEPQDWFGGTNLLRSKLPILAQLIVRQLRRGLEKKS